MRLLFTVPHYFRKVGDQSAAVDGNVRSHGSSVDSASVRVESLRETVYSIHQQFGTSQAMIRIRDRRTIAANDQMKDEVHVVVVTSGDQHLIDEAEFPPGICHQVAVDLEPAHLGFSCQSVLRDRWGNYDYYGFLEDDLAIRDPWLFEKLRWFNSHVGDEAVLLPNRYERARNQAYKKCYLDGDLADHVAHPFQDVTVQPELASTVMGRRVRFVRPPNPHSGCYFLNAAQMQRWMRDPEFAKPTSAFVGPLESAASLGVMKNFRVYKPATENANFLEIEHAGERFLSLIRDGENR